MVGSAYRLTVGACAAFVLAGCTSGLGAKPSAVAPTFMLDGLYKFVADGTGTRNGVPVNDLFKGETQWAFRTSCDDNGCVAAGGLIDPTNPKAAPKQVVVADYVDDNWSLVFLNRGGECPRDTGETFRSDQWSIWDATQTPENKLALKITVAGTDDCNAVSEFTPSLTRVGDVPAEFKLPDPANAPKRVSSFPANSFRGKYTVDYTLEGNGQSQASEHMDVKTTCLRAEERCVTTTINVDPRDPGTPYMTQVYEFAQEKFEFQQTIGNKQCQDGREGIASKAMTLTLPAAPVPDPLQTLTGRSALAFTGDCSGSVIYDAKFSRTGD